MVTFFYLSEKRPKGLFRVFTTLEHKTNVAVVVSERDSHCRATRRLFPSKKVVVAQRGDRFLSKKSLSRNAMTQKKRKESGSPFAKYLDIFHLL